MSNSDDWYQRGYEQGQHDERQRISEKLDLLRGSWLPVEEIIELLEIEK